MALNLLQIVQAHAGRQGLPVPAYVAGNPDGYAVQCLGLLNEFNEDLCIRKAWEMNVREATWTSTATESQGSLDTLAPFGFEGIIQDSFWDRTSKLKVGGGLTSADWAARKASGFTGPISCFRLRGHNLLLNPAPAAGLTYAFEYYSSFFVYDPGTVTVTANYKKYWSLDRDTSTVDDALAIAYLRWAWKREKGFDYAEDFAKYERMLATKAARQDSPQTVQLDCADSLNSLRGPGIGVQPGSWPL